MLTSIHNYKSSTYLNITLFLTIIRSLVSLKHKCTISYLGAQGFFWSISNNNKNMLTSLHHLAHCSWLLLLFSGGVAEFKNYIISQAAKQIQTLVISGGSNPRSSHSHVPKHFLCHATQTHSENAERFHWSFSIDISVNRSPISMKLDWVRT